MIQKEKSSGNTTRLVLKKGHTGHHDVHLMDNGNILFHDTWTRTQEITLGKEVVWDYESKTANGNDGKGVDVHAFARLENGQTMIAESGVGRFAHVDKDGKLVKEIPMGEGGRKKTRLVRMLDNGNYLACAEQPGVVTEYDTEGKVVWEYLTDTRVYGAIRLKNGNTLIATGSGNSVIEVSPEKEVVWDITKKSPARRSNWPGPLVCRNSQTGTSSSATAMRVTRTRRFLKSLAIRKSSGNLMSGNWLATDWPAGRSSMQSNRLSFAKNSQLLKSNFHASFSQFFNDQASPAAR